MLFYRLAFTVLSTSLTHATFLPLSGPDLPAPKRLSTSSVFGAAIDRLKAAIDQSMNGTSGAFQFASNASFATDVFSIYEDEPYMKKFHSGSVNASEGTSTINDSTIFRLGSISKLYTVYLSLISDSEHHWNNPITNYIPELANYMSSHNSAQALGNWNFTAMTLGDLAGQTSGLPRDSIPGADFDTSIMSNYNISADAIHSLPSNITDVDCSNAVHAPCNRSAFIENLFAASPVFPVGSQPAYSNIAYGLFALAMENITGMSFEALFDKNLVGGLNLTSTFYHPPSIIPGLNALIPVNASASGFNDSINNAIPAGGYFSSLADMRKMSHAILSSSRLSIATTNRWMKPRSFTGNLLQTVGDPWEIFTYNSSSGRKIDIYTKGGDWTAYRTLTAMIPNYGIGFNILAGGGDFSNAQKALQALIPANILDALEQAAIEEAFDTFNGTYHDASTNSTISLLRPTTAYNVSGPGLLLTDYTFNGTDMLYVLQTLGKTADPSHVKVEVRLYPTLLGNQNGTLQEWTALVYNEASYQAAEQQRPILGDTTGEEWFNISPFSLGGKSLYSFQFRMAANGGAASVTPLVFGSELLRA